MAEYTNKISELRQTLAWMDIVLSNVADSVCVIHENGEILFINDSFAQIINTPRIDLLGRNIQDVIKLTPKASSYPEAFPFIETNTLGSDSTKGIYEWKLEKNDTMTVKMIAHHIKPTNQVVIMLQNVTNEYEVKEISRNFTNLASHQLRTPLTVIKTHIHLLAEGYLGKLEDNQNSAAATILDATDHMNELLDMLLNISKIENNKYERRDENVYINKIILKICDVVKKQAAGKNIKFEINMPLKMKPFMSDAHMLHEVFSNLITNAVKYTPQGGMVCVSVAEDDNSYVVIVEDDGIGIPKQYHEKIFTQFYRAQNAIDSNQPGTGLGLYLVKQLVELLGGEINFKSAFKKGTTFWVTLPLYK